MVENKTIDVNINLKTTKVDTGTTKSSGGTGSSKVDSKFTDDVIKNTSSLSIGKKTKDVLLADGQGFSQILMGSGGAAGGMSGATGGFVAEVVPYVLGILGAALAGFAFGALIAKVADSLKKKDGSGGVSIGESLTSEQMRQQQEFQRLTTLDPNTMAYGGGMGPKTVDEKNAVENFIGKKGIGGAAPGVFGGGQDEENPKFDIEAIVKGKGDVDALKNSFTSLAKESGDAADIMASKLASGAKDESDIITGTLKPAYDKLSALADTVIDKIQQIHNPGSLKKKAGDMEEAAATDSTTKTPTPLPSTDTIMTSIINDYKTKTGVGGVISSKTNNSGSGQNKVNAPIFSYTQITTGMSMWGGE